MNTSLFIAQRLRLKGKTRSNSSSSGIIAVSGVAIAIIVMVITLTVVLGFKHQIRDKVSGFESQITINPATDYTTGVTGSSITLNDTLQQLIASAVGNGDNVTTSIVVRQPGIMKTNDNFAGLIFKGISPNADLSFIASNLVEGQLPDFASDSCKNMIVISQATAKSLNLKIGDGINSYFFTENNIRARKFKISGIYNSNFGEYDNLIAFAPLSTLQRLAVLDSTSGTSIEISGISNDDVANKSAALQSAINQAVYSQKSDKIYRVDNVLHSGAMYFNWLDLLDTNVVVILILMGCVAGFTLISCLFIIILERVKTIGLLKALGATNAQVRQIFIHIAQRLVLRGMIIGNILSLAFVFIQDKFHLIPLDPEAYYLSYVPVEINWWHIIALNAGVIVISSLVLILPSQLAATISPAQTMRYE